MKTTLAQRPHASLLHSVPVFAALPERRMAKLFSAAILRDVPPHRNLVTEGDAPDEVHFLSSGFARFDRRQGRRHVTISLMGPGGVFGLMATLRGVPHAATVVSLTACSVVSLPSGAFLAAMQESPGFASSIARHLANRLSDMSRQVELARGPLGPRVRALLEAWDAVDVPESVRLTNAEIARMLGCSREAVSRSMAGIRTARRARAVRSG